MSIWVQPNSLLDKNLEELAKFTKFAPGECEILRTDHAKLTKNWTGPTIQRVKTTRAQVVEREDTGQITDTIALEEAGYALIYEALDDGTFRRMRSRTVPVARPPSNAMVVRVLPDTPAKVYEETEIVADLITDAAQRGVKVILCGFRFLTQHYERLLKALPQINQLIIDESHKAYSTNESANTKALYRVMERVKYFAPMTGTLVDGRLDSAFPVIHIIEPRYYGSYSGFLDQHAGYIDNYNKVTRWINVEKLQAVLVKHFTKRTFTEVYGPEAVVFFTETATMCEKHRAKYDEFHLLAMLELEDGRILEGALPGVATIRARQIMAHPETLGIKLSEPTGKDQLLELHAGNSGPMVVFSAHVTEQERIVRLLEKVGRKVGLMNGTVVGKARAQVDLDFRSGKLDVIVASEEVASCGFNWGIAEHIVNVSLDYKDTNFVQAYRRGIRGVRTKPLRVTTLAYQNSIDQRVMRILVEKSILANEVDPDRRIITFE